MSDYKNTLFLPFEKSLVSSPDAQSRWVFLNARLVDGVENLNLFECEQSTRPDFVELHSAGHNVTAEIDELAELDGILILASRSRKLNELNLIRAWNGLKQGGVLVFSGDKTSGVQPLRKWMKSKTTVNGSLSKYHGVVFWCTKEGDDWPQPSYTNVINGFNVDPGMFSANGVDRGSQILVEHFDDRIFGSVADFGAGWGYLSAELLARSERIEKLDLFEADWKSLQSARKGLVEKANYTWCDLVNASPKGPYNWIVMNPPFHQGRAAEPRLGQIFIENAAKALPSGGRLLMVANINLPYERCLNSLFKRVEIREKSAGFKVIEAVKGSK